MIMLLVSCSMDVSVETSTGSRVNNIGLMHEQTLLAIVGLGLVLIGIVMRVSGRAKSTANVEQSHTYTAEEKRDLQALLSARGGTGIALSSVDAKIIYSVASGSPAHEAGIMPGDRIVQIDNEFASNDLRDNAMRLSGDPGTLVTLIVRRGESPITAEMIRQMASDFPVDDPSGPPAQVTPSKEFTAWPYLAVFGIGIILLMYRLFY